jgi:hypothetical protein
MIVLKSMFKDSLMMLIFSMTSPEPPKQPTPKTKLGGIMIQNNSKIEDSERPVLSLERKFEILVPFIRAAGKSFDYVKLIKQPLIWQNYPNLFNSIFLGVQRSQNSHFQKPAALKTGD